jgi:uncharacterized iron-regulated membrane protein
MRQSAMRALHRAQGGIINNVHVHRIIGLAAVHILACSRTAWWQARSSGLRPDEFVRTLPPNFSVNLEPFAGH